MATLTSKEKRMGLRRKMGREEGKPVDVSWEPSEASSPRTD